MAKPKKPAPKVARATPKPVEPEQASLPTLEKLAKAGDAAALAELVARTRGKDQSIVIAATNAIGRAGAYRTLTDLALESRNRGCCFTAMQQLERALKKHPEAVAALVDLCTDPRVDRDDSAIVLLANHAYGDAAFGKQPRVLASLRRVLVTEAHVYAQEAAVGTLTKLGDTSSLPAMLALLDRKQRHPDLCLLVGEAAVKLGGGAVELATLREALPKLRPHEVANLQRSIDKLTKRVGA